MLRADTSRRAREERDARRTAESGYDVEHEVWDLATSEHVRDSLAALPDGRARGDRAGLLRRVHVP